jgi:hypothetical protein
LPEEGGKVYVGRHDIEILTKDVRKILVEEIGPTIPSSVDLMRGLAFDDAAERVVNYICNQLQDLINPQERT